MSWPRREFRKRVVAVLCALLAAAITTSCGSSSSTTSTAGSQTAATPTGSTGSTQKAETGAAAGTPATQTTTSTTTSKAPPAAASVPVPATGGHLLHRYTGHGNSRLGTIVLHGRTVLVWYARHPGIQIFTSSGFILVKSGAPSGSVRLSRGTYRGVRVASAGNWSVELRSAAP